MFNMYVPSVEKNVHEYHLVNNRGNIINIERGRTYFWCEIKTVNGTTLYHEFCVDDFDNDRIQFNLCISDIIDDLMKNGYYNLF